LREFFGHTGKSQYFKIDGKERLYHPFVKRRKEEKAFKLQNPRSVIPAYPLSLKPFHPTPQHKNRLTTFPSGDSLWHQNVI
jgi:hypothetical protein